jgi:uncharacterized membrane protein YhaH (DUF805 family)
MSRTRAVLGLVASFILMLSSAAHSFPGWTRMREQLAAARVPPELAFGVKLGWLFAGVTMLAFGLILAALFVKRLRGESVSALPAVIVAIAYLGFGGWALVASGFDPFFSIFILPAVLLLIASPA